MLYVTYSLKGTDLESFVQKSDYTGNVGCFKRTGSYGSFNHELSCTGSHTSIFLPSPPGDEGEQQQRHLVLTDGGWKPGPGVVPFLSHILHHNPLLCLARFLRQEASRLITFILLTYLYQIYDYFILYLYMIIRVRNCYFTALFHKSFCF